MYRPTTLEKLTRTATRTREIDKPCFFTEFRLAGGGGDARVGGRGGDGGGGGD